MLDFKVFDLKDKELIDSYFYKFGCGSCQHSFVSSFCLSNKYDDHFAIDESYMFVLRNGKCTDTERIYLFPMGDTENKETLKKALDKVLDDAHSYDKKASFVTVTEKAKDLLVELYGDVFSVEEHRDYFEYIYTYDKLAKLPGGELSSKRYDLQTFFRDYGDRVKEVPLLKKNMDEVLKFQEWWKIEKLHGEEDVQLELEDEAIKKGLKYFKELGLSGIVVYIDNEIAGYAYGVKNSDTTYDVLIEKGNRKYPDIYKVLNRDLVRLCCRGYKYINREEDVGVEGLRKAKMSYKPDTLLKKFIVKEK